MLSISLHINQHVKTKASCCTVQMIGINAKKFIIMECSNTKLYVLICVLTCSAIGSLLTIYMGQTYTIIALSLTNSTVPKHRKNLTHHEQLLPVPLDDKTVKHNSLKFMTIEKISRMCNNMHEYAALLGLAAMTKHTPVISPEFGTLIKLFKLNTTILSVEELGEIYFKDYTELWGTACANITISDVKNMGEVNIKLHGWFESYRYFNDINDQIRAEFTFNNIIKERVVHFFSKNIHDRSPNKTRTTVGVHIRQGDLRGKAPLVQKGWRLPPSSYFNKAMDYFRAKYKDLFSYIAPMT